MVDDRCVHHRVSGSGVGKGNATSRQSRQTKQTMQAQKQEQTQPAVLQNVPEPLAGVLVVSTAACRVRVVWCVMLVCEHEEKLALSHIESGVVVVRDRPSLGGVPLDAAPTAPKRLGVRRSLHCSQASQLASAALDTTLTPH